MAKPSYVYRIKQNNREVCFRLDKVTSIDLNRGLMTVNLEKDGFLEMHSDSKMYRRIKTKWFGVLNAQNSVI